MSSVWLSFNMTVPEPTPEASNPFSKAVIVMLIPSLHTRSEPSSKEG